MIDAATLALLLPKLRKAAEDFPPAFYNFEVALAAKNDVWIANAANQMVNALDADVVSITRQILRSVLSEGRAS